MARLERALLSARAEHDMADDDELVAAAIAHLCKLHSLAAAHRKRADIEGAKTELQACVSSSDAERLHAAMRCATSVGVAADDAALLECERVALAAQMALQSLQGALA